MAYSTRRFVVCLSMCYFVLVFFDPVSLTLCCFVVYSTRRFVVCLSMCYFVLVFFGPVSLTLCCFVVYSTRRFVVWLSMCYFVLVFFSPFSIAITSLGEERANLSAFRTFVRYVLVWICRFPLPLGIWEGLRFVIVALPGLFLPFFFFFFFFK